MLVPSAVSNEKDSGNPPLPRKEDTCMQILTQMYFSQKDYSLAMAADIMLMRKSGR